MRTRRKADHGRQREAIGDDSQTRSVPVRLDKCENRLNWLQELPMEMASFVGWDPGRQALEDRSAASESKSDG